MRSLKLKSAIAVVLTVAAFGANAEGIADRHSERDFTSSAVANPYSGTQTVFRGEIIDRQNDKVEVAANPYSGTHDVLRGQIVNGNQGA
ncbi:hypothetical protein [Hahella ganghwensis]|uniref:hypothetical protein n=1 Tax=Hahella ganghwensis TaxID=286420 RepID=UPI000369B4F5|nr:hypothetical protein [Hahella ganghwensis]